MSIDDENPRLKDFLVENTLSYLYNINSSAVRVKSFKNVCRFFINKTCTYKNFVSLRFLLSCIGNNWKRFVAAAC